MSLPVGAGPARALRTVRAVRYVTPLREGGSLPAVIEADDDGLYVLKFRGAGQGARALVAELVSGELARAAGLPVPDTVLVEVDAALARTEPDAEIQDLIRASAGVNFGMDWLPGAVTFDPIAHPPDPRLASEIVWFDAFVTNVDRSALNTNLMVWHRRLWMIDHGATLVFQHRWETAFAQARAPFARIRDHVLLPYADAIEAADARLSARLTPQGVADVVARVPSEWLADPAPFVDAAAVRDALTQVLVARLEAPRVFVEEAVRARHLGL